MSLDLPVGLLAVIGANGAGKTTLISAIDVALFGPEGRSLASWYPRGIGEDPMSIELVFEHGGDLYRVRRSFSPKGRGQSKTDFERAIAGIGRGDGWLPLDEVTTWRPLMLESQTATQELIEATIGLSRATFRASSYLAQGDAGAFCDALPGQRKSILAEVVGLADWDRWLERARSEKRAGEMELAEARAVLERADSELEMKQEYEVNQRAAVAQERDLQERLRKASAALAAARERHAEVQRQAARRALVERAQKAADDAVHQTLDRIRVREQEVAELDQRLARRDEVAARAGRLELLEQEQERLREAVAAWRQRQQTISMLSDADTRLRDHAAEAARLVQQAETVLSRVGEEHCDRCGQALGAEAAQVAAASYRTDAARHADIARVADEEIIRLGETLRAMPDEEPDARKASVLVEKIRFARGAEQELAALAEAAGRRTVAAQELEALNRDLRVREEAAGLAHAECDSLGPFDRFALDDAQDAIRCNETDEAELRELITVEQRTQERMTARLERIAQVEQEAQATRERVEALLPLLELRAAMERACSPNGIPALILENVAIPQVEAEASRLLQVLGGPATSVELRTLRETKTGGVSDTLDIVLMTETGEASYETFSGGERARIAFALRLALAQLLAARKGADTGLLVVDEIDGLDAAGIAALVGVLEELQASVPRIVVVSHDAELRDAFPQSLLLENRDGRSRIVESLVPSGEVL